MDADRGGHVEPGGRVRAALRSPRLRLGLLGLVLAAGTVALFLLGGVSEGGIRTAVEESGVAGPLVYIALYATLTVLLFPVSVVTAAGGAVFGAALATLLTVIGATVGATVAFYIGRRLGRTEVEQIAGRRMGRIDRWLERRGFVAVLYARLLPVIPFNALNYVCGATSIGPRDYVIATAIGIVPGSFAYAALGSSLDDLTSPEFLAAAGLVLALLVAGPLVDRLMRARGKGPPEPDEEGSGAEGEASA